MIWGSVAIVVTWTVSMVPSQLWESCPAIIRQRQQKPLSNENNLSEKRQKIKRCLYMNTFPETNIAPESRPCQKESSLPTIHVQVLC